LSFVSRALSFVCRALSFVCRALSFVCRALSSGRRFLVRVRRVLSFADSRSRLGVVFVRLSGPPCHPAVHRRGLNACHCRAF